MGGVEHALAWSHDAGQTSWLSRRTLLTFISSKGGPLQLSIDGGSLEARGAHVQRHPWLTALMSWSLDRVSADAPVFVLTEQKGSGGCPGVWVDHWLELREGRMNELLTTGGKGEGGGDMQWFDGSVGFWGKAPESGSEADSLFVRRFPPLSGINPKRDVVVFEEDVVESQLCSGVRTVYRYRPGKLERVRVDVVDAGHPVACPK